MITVEEALEIVLENIKVLEKEKVKILYSLDRVLAEDVYATLDDPPFDSAAMDGYAVVAEDTILASKTNPIILEVIESLQAGSIPKKEVVKGTTIRIMTGAPIPKGADAVIMVEYTQKEEDEKIKVFKQVKKGENIRRSGEGFKKGELLLRKGTVIRPADIGLLASLGISEVEVIRRPKVAILATGDEIIDIEEPWVLGKVRNINSYTLYAQVLKYGGIPIDLGVAKDKVDDIKEKITSAMAADMILVSGGVSVGDHDIVKDVLLELGLKMKFWKVAMKPGKPTLFGLLQEKPVFGLPGYPVSSMIVFEMFVRPAMLKQMGKTKLKKPTVKAILEVDITKEPDRVHFLRAYTSIKNGVYYTTIVGPQGSGILRSMSLANSLIIVEKETTKLRAGDLVSVQWLDEPEE